MPASISALIPAYNEEDTVAGAIAATEAALKEYTDDYEIIVINDGSKDKTGAIIDAIAARSPRVRPLHNARNMNLGPNLRRGVAHASKEYCFAFISGDNYPDRECFRALLAAVGKKDMVIGYLVNYGQRLWTRRMLSRLFNSIIMNALFGFRIRYYNGPLIVKTSVWRTVPMVTNSFAYMAEVTATLLARGLSYAEVPFTLSPERKGVNLPMLRRNTLPVLQALAALFWRVRIKKELYA